MEENKTVEIDGADASAVNENEYEAGEGLGAEETENDSVELMEKERAEYDRLIKTRFKNFYTEDTQKMINRRFRKYKELEERAREAEKNSKGSAEKLSDCEIFEEVKRSVGQLTEELSDRFFGLADEESKESRTFMSLARLAVEEGKISLAEAYKLARFDEILDFEIKRAVRETEERVTADIISRKRRPLENAARSRISNGVVDTAKLTREERAVLAKRAANGEKIHF